MGIGKNIEDTIQYMKKELKCDVNFDIVHRTVSVCGRTCCMFFIDGFVKDDIIERIMEFFYGIEDESVFLDAQTFERRCIPYCETEVLGEPDQIITRILSGALALFADGLDQAILIDSRAYPQRLTSEPEKDKTLRGSKDGFVETIVFNTALIRRRIRSRDLCIEHLTAGTLSCTDVAVCYISTKADEQLVSKVRNRIRNAGIDALTMNQESLAELMIRNKWYNPFPKFKYTERPDAAAAQLLEGDVVIFVDNSPSAMILPSSIFDIMEEANDYYLPPFTASYLRLTRFLIGLVILFLTPVWILFMNNPDLVPDFLRFVLWEEPVFVPVLVQLLIMEVFIDGLKLASLNTPNMLNNTFSLLGAIILGDFAVQSGWFVPQAMLYMAVVAIGTYSQPSFEMGYALKFMRIFLLLITAALDLPGLILGTILLFFILLSNKTVSGRCYLYPLIPLDAGKLKRMLIRENIHKSSA